MSKNNPEILQQFFQSYLEGTEFWTTVFTEDITFTGPISQCSGKEDVVKLYIDFGQMSQGYELVNQIVDGDKLVMEGIYTIGTPKGGTINIEGVEIFQFENGKIKSVKLYHDAEEFRKEFAN